MKFFKYSWGFNEDGSEKYAIVQEISQKCKEVKELKEEWPDLGVKDNGLFARMIYGSAAKYSKKGKILWFSDIKTITELDADSVVSEHFVEWI